MSRRRPRPAVHVSHDRWLVSYADFITLLFAFFVVLYASSHTDKKKIAQLAAAIHGAFQQLDAFPGDKPNSYTEVVPELPQGELPPELNELMKSVQEAKASAPGIDVEQLRRELEKALGDEIKHGEIVMRVTPVGFVISLKELGFFNSGEARLLPGAVSKLTRIAKILNEHGFDIRVEGHTDNMPIHTPDFRSNWELSTGRATEVVRMMVEQFHIDPQRVSVAGYGEYHPISSNDTPEGRQMNRRVDLVVVSHSEIPGTITSQKGSIK